MSQTTESLAKVPEQKGPGGAPQNLPTDLTVAPGGAITAAAVPQQAEAEGAAEILAAVLPQDADLAGTIAVILPQQADLADTIAVVLPQQADLATAPESLAAVLSQRADLDAAPDSLVIALPQQADSSSAPDSVAALVLQRVAEIAEPAPLSAATPLEAAALNLTIRAEARWPESAADHTAPSLPGFIVSTFSPIAAETAARCLGRRPTAAESVTAVLITTSRGDRESAGHVARTVAGAGLLGPLLFFQSVPNAVAGHIATRWKLTGPVVCLADPASALEAAALLIEDGDADEALLVRIEQALGEHGHDQAHAVLLAPEPRTSEPPTSEPPHSQQSGARP